MTKKLMELAEENQRKKIEAAREKAQGRAYFVASRNLATFIDMMPGIPLDVQMEMKQIAFDLAKKAGLHSVPYEEFAMWGISAAPAPAEPEPLPDGGMLQ